jgi:probable rRNA maturation factor
LETPPEITVFDHVGWDPEQVERLQAFSERAVKSILELRAATDGHSPLQTAVEIEVSLVSDASIARVHADFMNIAGATDVITFHHGEILVSVDAGRARAAEFGHRVDQELALYIAHGLLHLHGYDDHVPEEAEAMRLLQEQVLSECWIEQ